jgi:alpha,alpha-trehalase
VRAARAGGFGLVIGVDRSGRQESMLREAGADLVVSDLSEVDLRRAVNGPRSALSCKSEIRSLVGKRTPILFLDYDGTLTPIVNRPEDARLTSEMRAVLRGLTSKCRIAIVSGRDRQDVADLVGLQNVIYAGSHGFDISGPDGLRRQHEDGKAVLHELDRAEQELRVGLDSTGGTLIERKRFGVAVHLRNVAEADRAGVERKVDAIADDHRSLARHGGKLVVELRPDVDWDKGKAVDWLLKTIVKKRADVAPFYIGDDLTDEDAFAAVAGDGIGIRVDDKGSKQTLARYRLRDTSEVRRFLNWLDDLLGGSAR